MTSDTTQLDFAISLGCTTLRFRCLSFASLSGLLTPHVGLILTLVIILVAQYARSPWRKIPPGPKGLPILGNALQFRDRRRMLEKDCKEKFRTFNSICYRLLELSRFTRQIPEHIMTLRVLGKPVIIFNSLRPAFELLDRRANIYSDRPRVIVSHEIFCGGLFTALMSYGELFVFALFFSNLGTYL